MRNFVLVIAGLVLAVSFAAYGPGSLDATRLDVTPADPRLEALFEPAASVARTERPDFHGAEDLEPGPDGRLYASLADGRIMARDTGGEWTEIADTGGRPLGLSFGPDGSLFVADALRGLMRLTADGWETWIASAQDGGELVFADDLTVLADGRIILTDASGRHGYGDHLTSFLEGDQTGRILMVTAPGEMSQLVGGLGFINGVDHDPMTGLVYVNETWTGRVWQLNPDTSDLDLLIDGLPGYPDNLEFDTGTGLIWVAMPSPRATDLEALHGRPLVKRLAWRWLQLAGLPPLPDTPAMAIGIDTDGHAVIGLRGPVDGAEGITTATLWQGELWTSGLARDGITVFAAPEIAGNNAAPRPAN
ncbi:SMP-30/gluconolactonase/LRE family protein [Maricaulis sp.]|uniref:SMP-30/gluconolactonase/LRE family protein n=1 Tax=Maricaulis sp. TaxID=1486257 RepID=UPI002B2799DE|nr:SMP-30/gluconolactonase/LRE family protein [Maricaulis sp.]